MQSARNVTGSALRLDVGNWCITAIVLGQFGEDMGVALQGINCSQGAAHGCSELCRSGHLQRGFSGARNRPQHLGFATTSAATTGELRTLEAMGQIRGTALQPAKCVASRYVEMVVMVRLSVGEGPPLSADAAILRKDRSIPPLPSTRPA